MSNPKKVVVDVISDVACPWCWVGKRAIETAAANINARAPNSMELELHWHPFQLSPETPQGTTKNLLDHLARLVGSRATVDKWVASPEAMPMNQSCKASKLENIHFRLFPDAVGFNTYRAHTLLTYAAKVLGDYKKQNALKEALLRMTHREGKNLDSLDELLAAAREAGVAATAEDLQRILGDDTVKKTLNAELQSSYKTADKAGVPHFGFPNGQCMLEGKSVAEFEKNLLEVISTA